MNGIFSYLWIIRVLQRSLEYKNNILLIVQFLLVDMARKVTCCVIALSLFFTALSQNTQIQTNSNNVFRLGLELVEKEKFAAAQKAFEDYLEGDADVLKAIEAEYYIAHCALHLDQPHTEALYVAWRDEYPRHPKAPYVFYELGNYKYQKKDYKEAIENYKRIDFRDLEKKHQYEAKFNLAYSYFRLKKLDKAEKYFDQIKGYNHNFTYASNYYSGYLKYKKGKYKEAITDFKVAEDNDLYKNAIPFILMNIYYQQEDYQKLVDYAESLFKAKRKITSKNDAFLLTAEGYYNLKNYQEASKYYTIYSKSVKKVDPAVWYRFGYSAWNVGDYESAVDRFKQVTSIEDSLGQYASYYLGESYLHLDNKPYALLAFGQAASVSFNKSVQEEALYDLGKLQYEEKQFKEAIASFDRLKIEFPQSKFHDKGDEIIAESYLNSEDYDDAISYIEGIKLPNKQLQATYQKVTFYKAVDLFNRRSFRQAADFFTKSIAYPLDKEFLAKSYFWRGETYSVGKKWDKAQSDYARLFKVDGADKTVEYVKGLYGIGYAYFNDKEYEKAKIKFEHYLRRVNELKGKSAYEGDASVRLADCFYFLKKYQESIALYEKALGGKIKNKDYVYYQLGLVYGREGNYKLAYNNFDKVIANENSVYESRAVLDKARLLLENQEYPEAEKTLTIYLSRESNGAQVPFALLQRARTRKALSNYAGALTDYDRLLTQYCSHEMASTAIKSIKEILIKLNDDSYSRRIDAYASCNPNDKNLEAIIFNNAYQEHNSFNMAKAILAFHQFLDKYPNTGKIAKVYYYLGDAYYNEANYDSSIVYFTKMIESGNKEDYTEALVRLGTMYLEKGQLEESIKYNMEALSLTTSENRRIELMTDLMMTYYRVNNFEETKSYATRILNSEIKNPWAFQEAQIHLGLSQKATSDTTSAVKTWQALMNSSTDAYGARANYEIAKVLFEDSSFVASNDTLKYLRKRYPSHLNWIGESFLLTAENFVMIDEEYNAVAVLKSLEKITIESIRTDAAKRLEELENAKAAVTNDEEVLPELSQEKIAPSVEEEEDFDE